MVEGRKIIQSYVSVILSVQCKNKIACVYIHSWPQYYSIICITEARNECTQAKAKREKI